MSSSPIAPREAAIVADRSERSSTGASGRDRRLRRVLVSLWGSLTIHALFLLLLISTIAYRAVPAETVETPVEVIIPEPAQARLPAPPPPAPQPAEPQASAGSNAFDARDIADEERERKADLGKVTRDGDGTEAASTAAPSSAEAKRDGEELDKDPNKEISRLVPPADIESEERKKMIAPPGPGRRPTNKDEPKTEPKEEATAKRQPLHCGENAKRPIPLAASIKRGEVLGPMTRDQALRVMEMTQARTDMSISPAYIENARIFVHVDGSAPSSWVVVLLPRGMSVQTGDRIEYFFYHLDPARPCHYIPNLASRVL